MVVIFDDGVVVVAAAIAGTFTMLDVVSDGVERLDGLAGVGGVLELFDGAGIEGIAGCACMSVS